MSNKKKSRGRSGRKPSTAKPSTAKPSVSHSSSAIPPVDRRTKGSAKQTHGQKSAGAKSPETPVDPNKPIFVGGRSPKKQRHGSARRAKPTTAVEPGSALTPRMLFFVLMFVLGFVIFGIGFNSLIGGYAKRNGTMTTAYVELGVGLFVATMFGTGLFRAMRQQEAERRRSTVRRNRRGTGGRGKSGRETSSRGQSSDSSVDS